MLLWVGSPPRHEEGPLSFISGARTNQPSHPPLTILARAFPLFGRGTSAKELGRAARRALGYLRRARVSSPGLLPLTTMPGQFIVRVVGAIGLAVFASTPAFASDVSAMSCSQIGGFALQVAEQKLKGVTLKDAVRRFRKSFGSRYADTDHELENIVRGIYRIPIFSTVSPEEVGNAYQIACEKGKSPAQITAIIYKESRTPRPAGIKCQGRSRQRLTFSSHASRDLRAYSREGPSWGLAWEVRSAEASVNDAREPSIRKTSTPAPAVRARFTLRPAICTAILFTTARPVIGGSM